MPASVDKYQKLNGSAKKVNDRKHSFFKKGFTIITLGLTGVFILLFLLRLVYVFVLAGFISNATLDKNFFDAVENLPKNYASENIAFNKTNQDAALLTIEQKYEKIAFIKTVTSQFENDQSAIKKKIQEFNGIIQFEKNSGLGENKRSHFVIAISPLVFESFCIAIQSVGVVVEKELTNIDKTLEYKRLYAKKKSLEKTLASLNEVRSGVGENSSFSLQDKISEMEISLREAEVELGYFTEERGFCTVKLSLHESFAKKEIYFIPAMQASFGWSMKYYPLTLLLLLFLFFFTNVDKIKLSALLPDKLKP